MSSIRLSLALILGFCLLMSCSLNSGTTASPTATSIATAPAATSTPIIDLWPAYQDSFESATDTFAGSLTGVNRSVSINSENAETGNRSLEVKNLGGANEFSIGFPIHVLTTAQTEDLSNKTVAVSVFLPTDSPIESVNIGFSRAGKSVVVPVRPDMGIRGRWFQLAVNLAEAARNPNTNILGGDWSDAQNAIRQCDTILIFGGAGADSDPSSARFLVDDLSWALWGEPAVSSGADSLRAHAPHGMYLGTVIMGRPEHNYRLDPTFLPTVTREFNLLWIGSEWGWPEDRPVNPAAIEFDYATTDELAALADANQMSMKMYTTGWYSQMPRWLLDIPFGEIQPVMENRIAKDIGRYSGRVALWDIFNETMLGAGNGFRNRSLADPSQGDSFSPYGYNYSPWVDGQDTSLIRAAYFKGRETDPNTLLFLNDYSVEQPGKPKSEFFYRFASEMKRDGVPLDGVGFQMHLFVEGNTVGDYSGLTPISQYLDEVDRNVRRFNDAGLLVEFSEVEVAIRTDDLDLTTAAGRGLYADRLQKQAEVYAGLMRIAKDNANVSAFIFWEATDTWATLFDINWPNREVMGAGALFDTYGRPKPAYAAVLQVLAE